MRWLIQRMTPDGLRPIPRPTNLSQSGAELEYIESLKARFALRQSCFDKLLIAGIIVVIGFFANWALEGRRGDIETRLKELQARHDREIAEMRHRHEHLMKMIQLDNDAILEKKRINSEAALQLERLRHEEQIEVLKSDLGIPRRHKVL